MRYRLGPDWVDMEFTARLTDASCAPLGYVAFMWASYMNRTRGRAIHFYGTCDGEEGWVRFGEDLPDGGFETGTVAHASVDPLPHEEGAQTLNIVEDPRKRFLLPFYYGLAESGMVYAMMFDQEAPIRFALWNFIPGRARTAGPPKPGLGLAVRHPRPGGRPDLPLPVAAPLPALRRPRGGAPGLRGVGGGTVALPRLHHGRAKAGSWTKRFMPSPSRARVRGGRARAKVWPFTGTP